jgi:hypothetical protein
VDYRREVGNRSLNLWCNQHVMGHGSKLKAQQKVYRKTPSAYEHPWNIELRQQFASVGHHGDGPAHYLTRCPHVEPESIVCSFSAFYLLRASPMRGCPLGKQSFRAANTANGGVRVPVSRFQTSEMSISLSIWCRWLAFELLILLFLAFKSSHSTRGTR